MANIERRFQRMSLEEIQSQPPGKWSSVDLLDVLAELSDAERNEETWARERAVRWLIMHSPYESDVVDYDALYFEQAMGLADRDIHAAIATAYAALVYNLQRDERDNAKGWLVEIAELFTTRAAISVGIGQFARIVRGEPTTPHYYYRLIDSLELCGLYALAAEALETILAALPAEADKGDVYNLHIQQAEAERSDWAARTDDLRAVDPQALADLRAAFALTLAGQANEREYLPPIRRLLGLPPAAVDECYREILAQGNVLIPELLYLAWDDTLYDTPACGHALELLRRLRQKQPAHFVGIDRWLDQAKGDWRDLLYRNFGLVGGYTPAELRGWAADAGCDWGIRSGATDALAERAKRHPEERAEVVAFLTELLDRPGSEANVGEETFTATVIGDLCDLGATEAYPAIEAAFQADRVDLQMLDLDYVEDELGLPRTTPPPRKDGLYLNLTCKRCGRARPHFVQHVTQDMGTQRRVDEGQPVRYDPHVMDREIVCPKCGAKESYELRGIDLIRLLIPLQGEESFRALVTGRTTGRPLFAQGPWLSRFESVILGRPMHPLEGLAEYRRRIQRNPTNVDLRVRMSLLLRFLHRFEESLEVVRGAYDVRPTDPEVLAFRAFAEHDFGDRATAEELYNTALPLLRRVMHRSEEMADLAGLVADSLVALEEGGPSAWQSMRDEQMAEVNSEPVAQKKKGKSGKKGQRR
ncbi:MAG: hypothetical protein KF753_21390 [Caldilineaceae bacterium]|nr:hypothetical protein [Caldilineaceae bacterium]